VISNGKRKTTTLHTEHGNGSRRPVEVAHGSQQEVAGYIADMVLELRNLAADNRMDFLAYLLEMSFQEAFDLSQKTARKD